MSTHSQRKQHSSGRLSTRSQHKRRRTAGTSSEMSTQTKPIQLEENGEVEVVDLTCESSSAEAVVDLTCNDSAVFVGEENPRRRRRNLRRLLHTESCVLSSDGDGSGRDDAATSNLSTFLSEFSDETANPKPAATVTCPICMDGQPEIRQSARRIVSTKCGHIFCSQCLRDALKNSSTCPTCRKKITRKQYHPIYI